LDDVEVQSIQAWGRWQKQRVVELDEIGFGRSGKRLIDDSVQTKVAFKTAASCTGKINAEKSRSFIGLRYYPVSFEPLPQKHGSILRNPSFRNATI
jgi:hypothetical protein